MTNPNDRFAIVPVTQPSAPAEAIVVGPMSEVMQYLPQTAARADALEELEHARFTADQITSMQEKTRAVQASILADTAAHLTSRLDAYVARRDARLRADAAREAEEEAKRIQDELAAMPDPDNPNPFAPTGDLHDMPPKDQDPGDLPEEPLSLEDQGALPEEIAKYVETPEPTPPKGKVYPQPIAVQLNSDEE
jgi:hypothetical protein